MTSPHDYSVPSRAKRRFATPLPSRDAYVEEQEFLLQPQDQSAQEQNEVNEPNPLRQHFTLLALGYMSFIFLKLSPGMFNTILSQILEGILCRQYHDTTDPTSDPRCKDESVQGELSILLSMKATFELLPTVIFSIPYGLAADVYGRKPVLIVATLGCVIYGLVNLVICTSPLGRCIRWDLIHLFRLVSQCIPDALAFGSTPCIYHWWRAVGASYDGLRNGERCSTRVTQVCTHELSTIS
jgi:hypothetical protein